MNLITDNNIPKIVQGKFVSGHITDTSTGISVAGDINFSGDLYQDGNIFAGGKFIDGTNTQDAVYTGVGTRNVGIGTVAPAEKLDVLGNIKLNTGGDYTSMNI